MMGGVPLLVDVAGARVVVVGGGAVAAAKLRTLLDAGAAVDVVSPTADADVRSASADGRLRWHARPYAPTDVDGATLVVAASSDAEVNARVAADAAVRRTFCVRADVGAGGTAAFLAAVRRGPLLLAVSTGGAAPALARRVREELARQYGDEWGVLAELMGELRRDPDVARLLAGLDGSQRAARWRAILDTDILTLLREGRTQRAKEVALACLSSSSA